MTVNVEARVEV